MFSKELFGKRIMELRKNHQEKQPILADLLGVSVAISARSSGATARPLQSASPCCVSTTTSRPTTCWD